MSGMTLPQRLRACIILIAATVAVVGGHGKGYHGNGVRNVVKDPLAENWDIQLQNGHETPDYIRKMEKVHEIEAAKQKAIPREEVPPDIGESDTENTEDSYHVNDKRLYKDIQRLIDILDNRERSARPKKKLDGRSAPVLERKKRLVRLAKSSVWTNGIIPYEFETKNLSVSKQEDIRHQMDLLEYRTMFRFVPHTPTTRKDYNLDHDGYAFFILGSGCWSGVGNGRSKQRISCCTGMTCVHEIGHLLGLAHEQTSYLRGDYLRVDMEEIKSDKLGNFYIKGSDSYDAYKYVDLASVMMYGFFDFHKNSQRTLSYLDRDLEVVKKRGNLYYELMQLQDHHDIKGTNCSGFKATCQNDGYVSFTNDRCQCKCPEGLDPDTRCTRLVKTVMSQKSHMTARPWPGGSFGLLKTQSGCADSFSGDGYVTYTGSGSSGISDKYSLSPSTFPSSSSIRTEFCLTSKGSGRAVWDRGSYCILKGQGACPSGFTEGELTLDADDAQTSSGGTLPGGSFTDDPVFKFCCRDDAYYERPIALPSDKPFVLFSMRYDECQVVKGMSSRVEFFQFTNYKSTPKVVGVSGKNPYVYFSSDTTYVYYCYYYPVLINTCGELVSLPLGGSYTLQSPNFPSGGNYNNAELCTWFIKSPDGTQLVMKFDAFDVATKPGGDCDDTLEITQTLPGHAGIRYCGSGFERTIVSETNTLVVRLRTDDSVTSKGVKAQIKVLGPTDLCYKNGGYKGGYSGTRNFTRHYHPCVPWSEVTHCRHHEFEDTDAEDSLESNYCRNPGNGLRPWCYIAADTCVRDYCDVCDTEECRDVYDDCAVSTNAFKEHCQENGFYCQKTCGLCGDCYTDSTTYQGTVSFTKNGKKCQAWSSDSPNKHSYHDASKYPDATVPDASNYCRNPDPSYGSLWCYTESESGWEDCAVPKCGDTTAAGACADKSFTCQINQGDTCAVNENHDHLRCSKTCRNCPSDCYKDSTNYQGTRSVTKKGEKCQAWAAHNPNNHRYHDASTYPDATVAEASNYCRNPDPSYGTLWCYLASGKGWDDCGVSSCDSLPNRPLSKRQGCSQLAPIQTATYSPVKVMYDVGEVVTFTCDGNTKEAREQVCSTGADGSAIWKPELHYVCGTCPLGWTRRGKKCYFLFQHDSGVDRKAAEAKCSNLGAQLVTDKDDVEKKAIAEEISNTGYSYFSVWLGVKAGPTSFIWQDGQSIGNNRRKDSYDMSCTSDPATYSGTKATTIDNDPCQRWDAQEPHPHNYATGNFPEGSATAANNYCRDPGNHGYLWCYTAVEKPEWGYCGIPICNDPSTCQKHSSTYSGTKSVTQNNYQCQRWDSQTPHSHRYTDDDSYPEGSVTAANNYCRDPGVDGYLWCYTTVDDPVWDRCKVPACDDPQICLYHTSEGLWSVDSCTSSKGVMCEYTPSRTVCLDQDSDCASKINRNPELCTRFPGYGVARCARSCGRCTAADPNADNKDVSCPDPQSPGPVKKLTARSSVYVGEVFEYECNPSNALSDGNLVRMCTLAGRLTGSPPVCKPAFDVDMWINDVDIRSRYYGGKGRAVYFAENEAMRVAKPGKVKAWRFYSWVKGWISLQVWRFSQMKGSNKEYQLIGQNVVMAKDDRAMYIDVPATDQISAQAGDVIAFHFSLGGDGGAAYDECSDGSSVGQFWSKDYLDLNEVSVGSNYEFLSRADCLIFSINAMIGP